MLLSLRGRWLLIRPVLCQILIPIIRPLDTSVFGLRVGLLALPIELALGCQRWFA